MNWGWQFLCKNNINFNFFLKERLSLSNFMCLCVCMCIMKVQILSIFFKGCVGWECGSVVEHSPCMYMLCRSKLKLQSKILGIHLVFILCFLDYYFSLSFFCWLWIWLVFNFGSAKKWTQGLMSARQAVYSAMSLAHYVSKLSSAVFVLGAERGQLIFPSCLRCTVGWNIASN